MTQENIELLKDLCARLPYKVIVHIRYNTEEPCYGELTPKDIQWFIDSKIKEIKPYLRPLSSMTKEEWAEYDSLSETCKESGYYDIIVDWLNSKHLDYRHLIEKDLALKAPKNMYAV